MFEREAVKKTLEEWAKINNIEIIDYDGFDRTDENLYKKLFTAQEFIRGVIRCTITGRNNN